MLCFSKIISCMTIHFRITFRISNYFLKTIVCKTYLYLFLFFDNIYIYTKILLNNRDILQYYLQETNSLISTGRKQLASRFNFTYRYIDDVLSIKNREFENYMGQIYPVELEIKDTTEQHFCFLPGFTSVDREGLSTSHFHLWQTWRYQFPHHKFSVPE